MDHPTRLFDFIQYQLTHNPQEKAYGNRQGGQWTYYSTQETIDKANQVSRGLLKLGVKPGDKIAMAVYQNASG